jgi:hypothetical protein
MFPIVIILAIREVIYLLLLGIRESISKTNETKHKVELMYI